MLLAGIEWGLGIEMNGGEFLSIPIVPLTRTGVAVVDLLGRPDERNVLRRIAAELTPTSYSRVVLGRKSGELGLIAPVEQLFPKLNAVAMPFTVGPSPFSTVVLR